VKASELLPNGGLLLRRGDTELAVALIRSGTDERLAVVDTDLAGVTGLRGFGDAIADALGMERPEKVRRKRRAKMSFNTVDDLLSGLEWLDTERGVLVVVHGAEGLVRSEPEVFEGFVWIFANVYNAWFQGGVRPLRRPTISFVVVGDALVIEHASASASEANAWVREARKNRSPILFPYHEMPVVEDSE